MASDKGCLGARPEVHCLPVYKIRVDLDLSRTETVILSLVELYAPIGLQYLVLQRIVRLDEAQSPDELGLPPHLVQAAKVFAQR